MEDLAFVLNRREQLRKDEQTSQGGELVSDGDVFDGRVAPAHR